METRDNPGIVDSPSGDESNLKLVFQHEPALVFFGVIACILAVGISVALSLFVWLMFKYPNSANVVVPLIMVPIVQMCIKLGGKVIDGVKAHKRINADPGKGVLVKIGTGQLEDTGKSSPREGGSP